MERAWMSFRLFSVVACAVCIFSETESMPGVGWGSVLALGLIPSAILFLWLMAVAGRRKLDFENLYSLTSPFWPMTTHPVQCSLVTSYGLIIGGALRLFHSAPDTSRALPGAAFLLLGFSMYAAAVGAAKLNKSQS